MNFVYLYFNLFFYIISFILSIFIINSKYKNEIYYLGLIIDFQNEDFDLYIKYLNDLKKKLKNETSQNENEKDKNDEIEENDKENNKDNKTKNKEKKSSKHLLIAAKKSEKKKLNKKGRKSKINKYHLQREEKKKIMSKYFLNQSIFSGYKIGFVFILAMSYYILIYFLYKNQKDKYILYDDIETDLVSTVLNTFLDYAKIKHEICDYINYLNEYNNCLINLSNNTISTCTISYKEFNINNISQSKFLFTILSYDDLFSKEMGNLILNFVSKQIKGDYRTKISNIHTGDMCLELNNFIYINYTLCSNYWDSILLQGLSQTIIYSNSILKSIIQEFNNFNKEQNFTKLNYFIDKFYSIEIYMINYFFPATKYEIILFDKLKKKKIKNMFKIFNVILYCSALEIIILYYILILSIFQMKKTDSLMNFVVIFPLKYINEKTDFYNEVLELDGRYF
jgi:hypothetical protein